MVLTCFSSEEPSRAQKLESVPRMRFSHACGPSECRGEGGGSSGGGE